MNLIFRSAEHQQAFEVTGAAVSQYTWKDLSIVYSKDLRADTIFLLHCCAGQGAVQKVTPSSFWLVRKSYPSSFQLTFLSGSVLVLKIQQFYWKQHHVILLCFLPYCLLYSACLLLLAVLWSSMKIAYSTVGCDLMWLIYYLNMYEKILQLSQHRMRCTLFTFN